MFFPKMMPELPKGILSDPRFQWLFRSAGGVHFWPGLGGNGGGVAIATSSAGFGALKNGFFHELWVTVHEYRIRALYHSAALAVTCIFNTNAAGLSSAMNSAQPKQLKSSCRKAFGFPESH